jgi:HEAT repeat protein
MFFSRLSLVAVRGFAASLSFVAAALSTGQARAAAFLAPSATQPGLAVGADAKGTLRAVLCAREPCDLAAGLDLGVPAEFRAGVPKARLSKVTIGAGRRAIVVSVPGGADGRAFEAVVVAPPGATAPKLVFAEVTGLSEGSDGVRQGKVLMISESADDNSRSIVVGQRREDLDLCGRPALLAPEVLSATDLALHGAKFQRLGAEERAQAAELDATLVADGAAPATPFVLRAMGASSAVGAPGLLTDGRLETSWSEARGGSGRGEFVVMNAPAQLPLSGFEIVVSAPGAPPNKASVPREVWLALRGQLFHVTLPPEASRVAGARFRVALPKPVQTDCVALVLESAFEERADAEVRVAELSAVSELSGADPAALFGALAGGSERAEAAGALLRTLGAPAYAEIAKGFTQLDEGGRRVALDVIDSAPCESSVPVYVEALLGDSEAQRGHADDRLRRCGRAAAPVLTQRLAAARSPKSLILAGELAMVAPDVAIDVVTPRLGKALPRERHALRVILARAASADAARANVSKLLVDPKLPSRAVLDLLRALGPRAASFHAEAAQALARLQAEPDFATQYLSLAPAAVVAPNDPGARAFLLRSLGGGEPRLRVRALEVMPRDATSASGVVSALGDPEVRVREAAANAARDGRMASGAPRLRQLLKDDPWPLVRSAAAGALTVLPADETIDRALLDALGDEAASVRAPVALALGARRVGKATPDLRARLEAPEEPTEVRRAAAFALGALCDEKSVGDLTKLSLRLGDPMATVEERALAQSALEALLAIGPTDLNARLAPLTSAKNNPALRALLANAAKSKTCGRR